MSFIVCKSSKKSSFCAIKPTCYSGIENTRRAPAVYVVSTFTVPCIWSAIIRQMLSPNPVPCTNESNLLNRSKIASDLSAGMPRPVSDTANVMWLGTSVSDTCRLSRGSAAKRFQFDRRSNNIGRSRFGEPLFEQTRLRAARRQDCFVGWHSARAARRQGIALFCRCRVPIDGRGCRRISGISRWRCCYSPICRAHTANL